MNFATNEVSLNPGLPTKSNIGRYAEDMVQDILDGNYDPIKAVVNIKSIYESFGKFLKDKRITDLVVREIEKYGKECTVNGVTLRLGNTGVKYDYTICGDPIYNDLKHQIDDLTGRIKEREKFLAGIPYGGIELTNPETGEIVHVVGPSKKCNESYTLTFPK